MIRKSNKLPGEVLSIKYYKEYSNVFTKDNSVITNHWLFKEFKKIIDIKV